MTSYLKIHSQDYPNPIEITKTQVFINKNIHEIHQDNTISYEYDVDIYDKDEYLQLLMRQQNDIKALREELQAAKILLGVE